MCLFYWTELRENLYFLLLVTSLCEQPLFTCRSGDMFLRLVMGHVPRKVPFVRDKELLSF